MEADFFLNPTDSGDLSELRACFVKGRLKDAFRDDYMLVEITPPIIGQKYGLGGRDISQVILATRHKGYTLFPVTEWPAFVYIIRILDENILTTMQFSANQVEMILWGVIHKSPPTRESVGFAVRLVQPWPGSKNSS